jgi:hypothetical protein
MFIVEHASLEIREFLFPNSRVECAVVEMMVIREVKRGSEN